MTDLVGDTTQAIIDDSREGANGPDDGFAAEIWSALVRAGLHLIGADEERGGSGGTWSDAAATVRATGSRGATVPLAEALFGVGPMLTDIGGAAPAGLGVATTFGAGSTLTAVEQAGGWRVNGRARRVPFARHGDFVTLTAAVEATGAGLVAVCPLAAVAITPGSNVAGEPRDDLVFDAVSIDADAARVAAGRRLRQLRRLAAVARAVQISGALDQVVAMTIRYANEREQFGRPIARFQAVAHQIAVLTGEAAVTSGAVDAAVAAIGIDAEAMATAAAKARASAAAGSVAQTAHQLFGALGFTREHQLHQLTRRLWSWRDEAGSSDHWHGELGALAFAAGSDGLWSLLTQTAPRSGATVDGISPGDHG
jgi:acyl-CoA dehydrogenase